MSLDYPFLGQPQFHILASLCSKTKTLSRLTLIVWLNSNFLKPLVNFCSSFYLTCQWDLTQLVTSFLVSFLYLASKIPYSWFSSHLIGGCVRLSFSPQPLSISTTQGSVLGTLLNLFSLSGWHMLTTSKYIFLIQAYFLGIWLLTWVWLWVIKTSQTRGVQNGFSDNSVHCLIQPESILSLTFPISVDGSSILSVARVLLDFSFFTFCI